MVYRENDNINWDEIYALSKLPSEELDKMLADEEKRVKEQLKM